MVTDLNKNCVVVKWQYCLPVQVAILPSNPSGNTALLVQVAHLPHTDIRCLKIRQYVQIIFVKFNKDSSCEMLYKNVNFNIQQKLDEFSTPLKIRQYVLIIFVKFNNKFNKKSSCEMLSRRKFSIFNKSYMNLAHLDIED